MRLDSFPIYGFSFGIISLTIINIILKPIPSSIKKSNDYSIQFAGIISRILSILINKTIIPSSLLSYYFIQYQPYLQRHIFHLFKQLPPTGLYKQNLDEFCSFCKHTQEVFKRSPRNILLTKYENQLQELYPYNKDIREIIKVLNQGSCLCNTLDDIHNNNICIPPKISFHKMIKEFDNIPKGKLYGKYNRLITSPKPTEIFTESKIEVIKQGIIEKNKKKGNIESLDIINKKIGTIIQNSYKKYESQQKEAENILKQLNTDKDYLHYLKINEIWHKYGLDKMKKEYKDIDKQVGYDRSERGLAFEQRANIVFNIILHKFSQSIKEEYSNFHYVQSAIWLNNGKPVGELDLVIMGHNKKSKSIHILAIVEMKSNFYALANAWYKQHANKLSDNKSHIIQLPNKQIMTITERIPEFYIATIIPKHIYLIGAEKSILDKLIDPLSIENIINDKESMKELMENIHNSLELTISPKQVLKKHSNNIIVLL